uniref:UDP-glycosyltransferases domain-containing protein n=1 Tax=Solanum lycopersicum TaxID=4081 RepID=A0A3Q7H947_SOLLC
MSTQTKPLPEKHHKSTLISLNIFSCSDYHWSHLVSICKFVENLVSRDERVYVTILIIISPWDAYIKRCFPPAFSGTFLDVLDSRIRYITLAQIERPYPEELPIISNKSWPDIDSNPKIIGLVSDMFSFFTSGAGFLGFLLYLSVWHDQFGREFNRSDPVTSKVLPTFAFVKEADPQLTPVYTVGFLLYLESQNAKGNSKSEDEEIMKWLDQQLPSSVLFLCFGSAGNFQPSQRLPVNAETTKLEEISPEGFLERTKDRGIVCGWAPQVNILAHKAIGEFVSHCGWNSTMEKQQINTFQLVKDIEMAVELTLTYKMEKVIRSTMDSKNLLRKRVKDMEEIFRKELTEGGSSFISVERFAETILDSCD